VPAEQFEDCTMAQLVERAVRIDEDVCDGEYVPPAHVVQVRSAVAVAAAE
jgi:hypothetical protein